MSADPVFCGFSCTPRKKRGLERQMLLPGYIDWMGPFPPRAMTDNPLQRSPAQFMVAVPDVDAPVGRSDDTPRLEQGDLGARRDRAESPPTRHDTAGTNLPAPARHETSPDTDLPSVRHETGDTNLPALARHETSPDTDLPAPARHETHRHVFPTTSDRRARQGRARCEGWDAQWGQVCDRLGNHPEATQQKRHEFLEDWYKIYNDVSVGRATRLTGNAEHGLLAVHKTVVHALQLPASRLAPPLMYPRMMAAILKFCGLNILRISIRRAELFDSILADFASDRPIFDDEADLFAVKYALQRIEDRFTTSDFDLLWDRHVLGYTLKELAEKNGCSTSSAKRRLDKIYPQLRAMLQ